MKNLLEEFNIRVEQAEERINGHEGKHLKLLSFNSPKKKEGRKVKELKDLLRHHQMGQHAQFWSPRRRTEIERCKKVMVQNFLNLTKHLNMNLKNSMYSK